MVSTYPYFKTFLKLFLKILEFNTPRNHHSTRFALEPEIFPKYEARTSRKDHGEARLPAAGADVEVGRCQRWRHAADVWAMFVRERGKGKRAGCGLGCGLMLGLAQDCWASPSFFSVSFFFSITSTNHKF